MESSVKAMRGLDVSGYGVAGAERYAWVSPGKVAYGKLGLGKTWIGRHGWET